MTHNLSEQQLAERLNTLVPPEPSAPLHSAEADPLVNAALHIAKAPRPMMPVDKKNQLLSQILAAHQHSVVPAPPPRRLPLPQIALLAVGGVVLLTLLVVLAAPAKDGPPAMPAPVTEETFTPVPTVNVVLPPVVETAPVDVTPEMTAISELAIITEVTIEPGQAAVMIEGPVSEINDNVITIYGFDFVLDPDDPLLSVIKLGDVLIVQGDVQQTDDHFTLMVTAMVFMDAEVYMNDEGVVWRDSGDCNNPPPPWASANGWRLRCEGGANDNNNTSTENNTNGAGGNPANDCDKSGNACNSQGIPGGVPRGNSDSNKNNDNGG